MYIRLAKEQDIDGIIKLLVQVNNVHSVNRPDLFLVDKTKYTTKELQELLKNKEKPVFVAVDDEEKVLGYSFCVVQSHIEDNNYPDIKTLYIDDLCVDEACRQGHVGTELYHYVKKYAKDNGFYNITLNVWDKNDAAIAFYKKCGFHIQKYGMEVII